MSSLSVSPGQARAFRSFVVDVLQREENGTVLDPPHITTSNVLWARRNHPSIAGLYVTLNQVSFVPIGPAYSSFTPNADGVSVDMTYRVPAEWTVSVQVVDASADDDPSLVGPAYLLRRLVVRAFVSSLLAPLRSVGLAPLRVGQISDLTRLARNVQWQAAANVDLTFSAMPVTLETVESIDTVAGTIELADEDGGTTVADVSLTD